MNTESPYPISLEKVVFTRSSVIAIPGHEYIEGTQLNPANKLDVHRMPDHDHRFMAIMSCKVNEAQDKSLPYAIDMECIATFTSDGTLSPDEEMRGVTINANSVCYGAIRETVAWLTARQPYGGVMLGFSVLRPQAKNQAAAGSESSKP